MSRYVFKLPDLGEGAVDAEIVAWRVAAGEEVQEDQPLVEMLTQKATIEVPAPVAGRVLSTTGTPGERVAVGAELAVFETSAGAEPPRTRRRRRTVSRQRRLQHLRRRHPRRPQCPRRNPIRAAWRRRLRSGVAPATLALTWRASPAAVRMVASCCRIWRRGCVPRPRAPATRPTAALEIQEIPVIGLRRLIAEQVAASARNIPHFAYVEEVDVTALESLREQLNASAGSGTTLTYLPFIVRGLIRALGRHPQCNARYDAARQMLLQHRAVHVGIAVQTPQGLKVPVIRDAQKLALHELDAEIRRLSTAARDGRARPQELTGSTITVTSLGKLGGIASTPIINQPELAIIGVNRAVERPVVHAGAITVRRMMNLSSSFDHRFIDGFDAARLIQTLREGLEQPALLFM